MFQPGSCRGGTWQFAHFRLRLKICLPRMAEAALRPARAQIDFLGVSLVHLNPTVAAGLEGERIASVRPKAHSKEGTRDSQTGPSGQGEHCSVGGHTRAAEGSNGRALRTD